MTSIIDQFEFLMKEWVNNSNFPDEGAGADALLGPGKTWVVPDRWWLLLHSVGVRAEHGALEIGQEIKHQELAVLERR